MKQVVKLNDKSQFIRSYKEIKTSIENGTAVDIESIKRLIDSFHDPLENFYSKDNWTDPHDFCKDLLKEFAYWEPEYLNRLTSALNGKQYNESKNEVEIMLVDVLMQGRETLINARSNAIFEVYFTNHIDNRLTIHIMAIYEKYGYDTLVYGLLMLGLKGLLRHGNVTNNTTHTISGCLAAYFCDISSIKHYLKENSDDGIKKYIDNADSKADAAWKKLKKMYSSLYPENSGL